MNNNKVKVFSDESIEKLNLMKEYMNKVKVFSDESLEKLNLIKESKESFQEELSERKLAI